MKGIILAGGSGTRLGTLTKVVSKQLLPIYDMPVIYYPLSTLMLAGIKDILIISTPRDTPIISQLLVDGSQWGINLSYAVQREPKGIAQAFTIGASFIGNDRVTLILGDNLFWGLGIDSFLKSAIATPRERVFLKEVVPGANARIFAHRVPDPQRFGVVEIDDYGRALSLEEKPEEPRSNWAVTGLYVYDNDVVDIARSLKPSARGELEITDVNRVYISRGVLEVFMLSGLWKWLDVGTPDALLEASEYVKRVRTNHAKAGTWLGNPEAIALYNGWIE